MKSLWTGKATIIIVLIGALLLLFGCKGPEQQTPTEYTVSGRVFDQITGGSVTSRGVSVRTSAVKGGIEGATVLIGDEKTTTDADGTFSFTYTQDDPISATIAVYKEGYHFAVFDNAELDISTNPTYSIALEPVDSDTYQTKQVEITFKDGDENLLTDTTFYLSVFNSDGGASYFEGAQTNADGVGSFELETFGSNCSLLIINASDYKSWYEKEVDLSADTSTDPIELTFTEPASFTELTFDGKTGNGVIGILLPGDETMPTVMPNYFMLQLQTDSSDTFKVYDPADSDNTFAFYALNGFGGLEDQNGDTTSKVSISSVAALPADGTITLPELLSSPVLTPIDGGTVTYAGDTRTISFTDSGDKANQYELEFETSDGSDTTEVGTIVLSGTSFVIPEQFYTDMIQPVLDNGKSFTVNVVKRYAENLTSSDWMTVLQGGYLEEGYKIIEVEDTETTKDAAVSTAESIFQ